MKPTLLLAFTVAATNIVMGKGDDELGDDALEQCESFLQECKEKLNEFQAEDEFDCSYECSTTWGDVCMPQDFVCDGLIDCEDGSDEDELTCGEGWVPEPWDYWEVSDCTGGYECSSVFGEACIPQMWVCDTLIDCEDGSDEDELTCGEGWMAEPFDYWYDRRAEAPIDVKVPAEARRKPTIEAVREARVKARAEAVA